MSDVASISVCTGNLALTILAVDDEEAIRSFVAEFFQDFGYHVLEAGDVAQAKRVLARNSVDLVFSDVNMPGAETGFDLEKWVRRHYPETKVLLTSGYPQSPGDTAVLLEPLLPKPYTCSKVLERINRLIPGTVVSGHGQIVPRR